ncbi:MAG: amidohydrolase family protein [Bacteroidota bacterium]
MKTTRMMKTRLQSVTRSMLALIVLSATALASDPVPAAKQKKPIALVGGTIHTVSGETIQGGTIVFDKGRITVIGTNVTIPTDAEKISVAGKHVYPGLINASTTLGLTEIASVRGSIDETETGTINPNARAEVAVNPESELIPVARSGGVAIVATIPQGGLLSGTAAAMMLDGWTWEEMTLKAPLGLVVNWPAMTYVQNRFNRQTKEEWQKQRDDQLKAIRDAFAAARAYMIAKGSEKQRGVPYHETDSRWEAMIPVLQGSVPVWVYANELSQIQAAVTWAEEEGVKLVLVGGRDSWRVSNQLKAKNIPVLIENILASPGRRWEDYDGVYTLPGKLYDAGVSFAVCVGAGEPTADASSTRDLVHHAAIASAYGLAKDEALKSVTLYPARILGISDRVGSLEIGKDATLIITTGDPLDLETTVEQVYIQGKKCDMRDKHKQLYEKYKEKYKQLSNE